MSFSRLSGSIHTGVVVLIVEVMLSGYVGGHVVK